MDRRSNEGQETGQRMKKAVSQSGKGSWAVGWTGSPGKIILEDRLIRDPRGGTRVRRLRQESRQDAMMTCTRLEKAEVMGGAQTVLKAKPIGFAGAWMWGMGEREETRKAPKNLASATKRMECH